MLFTVVIPYRNRAAFLPRTLQSVAAQTYRNFRLLLVDNGSTDASRSICEAFEKDFDNGQPEIWNLNQPSGGACAARNLGLLNARTDYVYFFDSDDEMSPAFLSDAAACIERAGSPDIVAAQTRMAFPGGKRRKRVVFRNASVRDQILTGQLATQGMVLKTDFLRQAGGWNERLPKWNDWELGVRLLLARPRVEWLPGAYHYIHQHADSLTGASLAATYDDIRPALRAVRALVEGDRPAREALAAREVILAAELQRAGLEGKAAPLLQQALSVRPSLKYLHRYARLGGRGAWQLFRLLYR